MATRRSSDERPSSEERRARARAERRIVMPSNRVSRPKDTVRSSSSATAQSSSARPSSSASRPSAPGRNKTEELFEGSNPAQRWRGRRRDGEARWRCDDGAPCRISVESFSRHGFAGQGSAQLRRPARRECGPCRNCEPSCRQAPFPRAPHCPGGSAGAFSARRRRLGPSTGAVNGLPASTMACRWARWMSPA